MTKSFLYGTAEYAENFWNMIRNRGHYGEVRNALSVGEDTEGGFTVPDEFEKKLVEALEENNIFRGMATVIRTSSGTRKIPIAEDTGEASWIDEGEEIPESDATFGQTIADWVKIVNRVYRVYEPSSGQVHKLLHLHELR